VASANLQPRVFFSLKWKALLLTSLVLVAVTVTISLRNYTSLRAQFERHSHQARAGYVRDLEALVNQSLTQMRHLGGLIASLAGMREPLLEVDAVGIEQALSEQLPALGGNWGVDALGFYDNSSRLLTRWEVGQSWDRTSWPARFNHRILAWIARANATRDPVRAISCTPHCTQFVAVPMFIAGQKAGVVLVGSQLTAVVNRFYELSENDIGVILTGETALHDVEEAWVLASWDAVVAVVTEPPVPGVARAQTLDILREVAASSSLESVMGKPRKVAGHGWHEISLSPLPGYFGAGSAYVAVIADITENLYQIRQATQETVLVGLVGWLLAELLLLGILWAPMSRLRLTADNLLLLARRQFDLMRTAIWRQSRSHLFRDEIDILDSKAIELADRLEQLERDVDDGKKEISRYVENLLWLSHHDSLTQLCNRRRFQEELEHALAVARGGGDRGAVLLVDLDQFKDVNSIGGHQSGDAMLQAVARALAERFSRHSVVVSRLSGDEFAILAPRVHEKPAVRLATKVNEVINQVSVPVDGRALRLSASIGIVLFPEHGMTVTDLMANAGVALRHAKEVGRGHWRLFDQSLERLRRGAHWRDKVAQALNHDRFVLYFQPIMEIKSGGVSHYEVLLKMRDEQGGIVGAKRFMEAAEDGGFIHDLDRKVVKTAVKTLAEVNARGWNVAFSINLSGHFFSDRGMLLYLRQIFEQTPIDPGKIIFEITETAIWDFSKVESLMLAIQKLGCRFALDDFGSGFPPLSYLRRLPVDYLKIDGVFIRQLPSSVEDQIIVRLISQAAKEFGKITIAEYVENEATLRLLRSYGVHYAQGYLVGEPLSADMAFPALMISQG
jgi:diguanylate cyclase (GGDEF)-like protein